MNSIPTERASSPATGKRKTRDVRWNEIIAVATEVFYEEGYKSSSLQEIADRLQILKGSLYYYIKSKDDLLFEVIRTTHEAGLKNITLLAAGPDDALVRLGRVVSGHVDFVCRNVKPTAVFLHELGALNATRRLEVLGEQDAYLGVFRNLITEAQKQGLARTELDPGVASLAIIGSLNWIYRWFRPGGLPPDHLAETFADMAVRSLATNSALGFPTDTQAAT